MNDIFIGTSFQFFYFSHFRHFVRAMSFIILFNNFSCLKYASIFNSPIYRSSGQRSKSCTERKDIEEPSRVCKNPKESKRKKDCSDSKFKNNRCLKAEPKRCAEYNKLRNSERSRKRNPSRVHDKNCGKIDEKRRYSTQSIFPVSRDHRSFSTLIPDIVLNTDVGKTTKALYSSCSEDKKIPSCEEQKRKCEKNPQKDEKKCVKGPAKCLSRKSEMQNCPTTQKDQDKMIREPRQKSCDHTEYCSNRKLQSNTKGKFYVS